MKNLRRGHARIFVMQTKGGRLVTFDYVIWEVTRCSPLIFVLKILRYLYSRTTIYSPIKPSFKTAKLTLAKIIIGFINKLPKYTTYSFQKIEQNRKRKRKGLHVLS